ncbi:MAG: STAS domain-containing protein [bacterium]
MITIAMEKGEVNFSGELSIHVLDGLRKKLDEILDKSSGTIILNFEKVVNMDCAALQLLLAFKRAAETKSKIKIVNVNNTINKILRVSGLERELISN